LQKYIEPEFNIVKVNAPDVICTSIGPSDSVISEKDNAYVAIGKLLGGGGFFIDI
jgi:hypothetical protein